MIQRTSSQDYRFVMCHPSVHSPSTRDTGVQAGLETTSDNSPATPEGALGSEGVRSPAGTHYAPGDDPPFTLSFGGGSGLIEPALTASSHSATTASAMLEEHVSLGDQAMPYEFLFTDGSPQNIQQTTPYVATTPSHTGISPAGHAQQSFASPMASASSFAYYDAPAGHIGMRTHPRAHSTAPSISSGAARVIRTTVDAQGITVLLFIPLDNGF